MTKNVIGIAVVAAALILGVLLLTDRDAFAWVMAIAVLVAVIIGDVIRVHFIEHKRKSV